MESAVQLEVKASVPEGLTGAPDYASPQPDATSPGGFRDVAT